MRRYLMIGFPLLLLVAFGIWYAGWLEQPSSAGLVPMDQVPQEFLMTAHQQLPEVKFDKVWKLRNGNYEIRGKDNRGRAREVELNAKGEVVEVD